MCGLGTWELLIVLAIVVLIFGASRLPQLGKALGETVKNFKKGADGPEAINEPKGEPLPKPKAEAKIEAHEVAQLVEGDEDSKGSDDKS